MVILCLKIFVYISCFAANHPRSRLEQRAARLFSVADCVKFSVRGRHESACNFALAKQNNGEFWGAVGFGLFGIDVHNGVDYLIIIDDLCRRSMIISQNLSVVASR